MKNTKRKFSPEEKAKVALSAIKEDETIAQLSSRYQLHSNQIIRWKKIAKENLSQLFSSKEANKQKEKERESQELINELYKLVGQRDLELAWLKKKLSIFDP